MISDQIALHSVSVTIFNFHWLLSPDPGHSGKWGSGRECYHQCACLFSPSRLNPPYPIFFLYLTTKLKIAIPFTLFLHIVLLTLLILAMCYSLVMCEPSRDNMILCSLDSVYDGPSLQ